MLTYKYDPLGRRIDEYNDSSGTPALLDAWSYDKTPLNNGSSDALGYLTSDTSYDSSGAACTETITSKAEISSQEPGPSAVSRSP